MSLVWSRYNYQYNSEKHGQVLFNAVSNRVAQVTPDFYEKLVTVREHPDEAEKLLKEEELNTLKEMKVLLNKGDEEFFFMRRRHMRYNSRYGIEGKRSLGLTIAPTMACNFACIYCFEGDKDNHTMSDETAERLVSFVKDSKVEFLNVVWFGGEPLMQFKRMCELTGQFKALLPEKNAFRADLVTNAYFLTKDKADKLDELHIKGIQITIDGVEEDHNKKRSLKNGGGTFGRIIENLDYVLKVWDGKLSLRCNVYPDEIHKVKELNLYLNERFSGLKNIPQAYPGFIHDFNEKYPAKNSCSSICSTDAGAMLLSLSAKDMQRHMDFLYPDCKITGCVATGKNGYVVGPLGDIYKCWDDLGEKDRVVGSLYDEKKNWDNHKLAIEYILGSDSFDDPECGNCFFAHICDGGCPKLRRLKKFENKDLAPPCIPMKGHIKEVLDYICDNYYLGQEVGDMLFSSESSKPSPITCLN